jgi:hypothetical protein
MCPSEETIEKIVKHACKKGNCLTLAEGYWLAKHFACNCPTSVEIKKIVKDTCGCEDEIKELGEDFASGAAAILTAIAKIPMCDCASAATVKNDTNTILAAIKNIPACHCPTVWEILT